MTFINREILDNSIEQWLLALLMVAVITSLIMLIRKLLTRHAQGLQKREPGKISLLFSEIIGRTRPYLLVLATLYPASLLLELSGGVEAVVKKAAFIAVVFQVGVWAGFLITTTLKRYLKIPEKKPDTDSGFIVMNMIGRAALWTFILLVILENIGVNVTTLIASLGVLGIAIGLATQNILGDLFASLSILLDQPFQTGDFIIVGDDLGTVEKIGLKTTRVRSLSGELLIFSNNDLLQSRIRNFTNFEERRVGFSFGVLYSTPASKLRQIPDTVREIIENIEEARFDRAHFKKFGDSSLEFEVIYYVLSPDYARYMDIQQKINMALFESFEADDIGFAFPTQTIHIASQPEGNAEETRPSTSKTD